MTFEFATANRVVFGSGTAAQLPALCSTYGQRVLVVTGSDSRRHQDHLQKLEAAGLKVVLFSFQGEPRTDHVREGVSLLRSAEVQVVVAIGGGSVIDAGKAMAAMATQPGDLMDYLEVVGKGQALTERPLPFLAVPTTAGTGAEVTRNAVLSVPDKGVKASLRHTSMLPAVALVDPDLARGLPPAVVAASGMDALTQCLEAYVSSRAQPFTDALCIEGIQRAAKALERAWANPEDQQAREDLAFAALLSGMALANAGLGAVHGFAAPIGGLFSAPHGAVCAALLAPAWQVNLQAVQERGSETAQCRFQSVAQWLTQNPQAEAAAAVPWLQALGQRLSIPKLSAYGINETHVADVTAKAMNASSMKGNPVPLTMEELTQILRAAL